jgi:hypothetical protein
MPRLYVLLEPCNEACTFMAPLCSNASPKMYWEMGKLLITLQSKLIGAWGWAYGCTLQSYKGAPLPYFKGFWTITFLNMEDCVKLSSLKKIFDNYVKLWTITRTWLILRTRSLWIFFGNLGTLEMGILCSKNLLWWWIPSISYLWGFCIWLQSNFILMLHNLRNSLVINVCYFNFAIVAKLAIIHKLFSQIWILTKYF